ncbi:MAG: hypothetical protein Greene041679_611, partial [Parcubacteria group bacterium Greene0416_79]
RRERDLRVAGSRRHYRRTYKRKEEKPATHPKIRGRARSNPYLPDRTPQLKSGRSSVVRPHNDRVEYPKRTRGKLIRLRNGREEKKS